MAAPSNSGPTEGDAVPDGWIPLGPWKWSTPALAISVSSSAAAGLVVYVVFEAVGVTLRSGLNARGVGIEIAAILIAFLVAAATLFLVQHIRYPRPFVNFAIGRIRAGRRTVDLAEINWARFGIFSNHGKREHITIAFGAPDGPRFVFIAGPGRRAIAEATRELVAEVIRRSEIEYPASPYDPAKRFARYNFPTNLDKATALRVVTDPAGIIDELQVA
jgi:hypothetical protein